jgi:hypothetical protein
MIVQDSSRFTRLHNAVDEPAFLVC